jgi:hypothetical protein
VAVASTGIYNHLLPPSVTILCMHTCVPSECVLPSVTNPDHLLQHPLLALVCPLSVLSNWASQVAEHTEEGTLKVGCVRGSV